MHRHTESLQVDASPEAKNIWNTLLACAQTYLRIRACLHSQKFVAWQSTLQKILPSALAPLHWEVAYKCTIANKADQGLWKKI